MPYREGDVIATFLSESAGKLTAIARGGRRSSKRLGGTLEPFHTIQIDFEDTGKELVTLNEATVATLRGQLVQNLDALDAAGTAMRWGRFLFPTRSEEPIAWNAVVRFLDAVEENPAQAKIELIRVGFDLLAAFGYAMDFEKCVRCGKTCPEASSALMDPARGGTVCRACGGGPILLDAVTRVLLARQFDGSPTENRDAQIRLALDIIETAMAAHAGLDPHHGTSQ